MLQIVFFLWLSLPVHNNSGKDSLTLMSYNIHHGTDKDEKATLDSMGIFIRGSGAAIVGLQEVDSVCQRSGKTDQMKRLAQITGRYYAFVRHFAFQEGAYGQGILSRYPIKKIENIRLSLLKPDTLRQSLALITAEIAIPGKGTLLLANAHFSLDPATRLVQAREVLNYLKKKNLPAVFMGDLNATPDQEEIQLLKTALQPVNDLNQPSFPAEAPIKTIDYIFVTRNLNGIAEKKILPPVLYSDHLPVQATIQF